jgi:hypothetical protein
VSADAKQPSGAVKLRERTYSAEFASGLRATLTVGNMSAQCEWSPYPPRFLRRAKRERLLQAYRVWRDECLTQYGKEHGLTLRVMHIAGMDVLAFAKPR